MTLSSLLFFVLHKYTNKNLHNCEQAWLLNWIEGQNISTFLGVAVKRVSNTVFSTKGSKSGTNWNYAEKLQKLLEFRARIPINFISHTNMFKVRQMHRARKYVRKQNFHSRKCSEILGKRFVHGLRCNNHAGSRCVKAVQHCHGTDPLSRVGLTAAHSMTGSRRAVAYVCLRGLCR